MQHKEKDVAFATKRQHPMLDQFSALARAKISKAKFVAALRNFPSVS